MTKTIQGFHGLNNRYPANILVFNDGHANWYTQIGGTIVFMTYEDIEDGVNIDYLVDEDEFSYEPINTEEELQQAVELY